MISGKIPANPGGSFAAPSLRSGFQLRMTGLCGGTKRKEVAIR